MFQFAAFRPRPRWSFGKYPVFWSSQAHTRNMPAVPPLKACSMQVLGSQLCWPVQTDRCLWSYLLPPVVESLVPQRVSKQPQLQWELQVLRISEN